MNREQAEQKLKYAISQIGRYMTASLEEECNDALDVILNKNKLQKTGGLKPKMIEFRSPGDEEFSKIFFCQKCGRQIIKDQKHCDLGHLIDWNNGFIRM